MGTPRFPFVGQYEARDPYEEGWECCYKFHYEHNALCDLDNCPYEKEGEEYEKYYEWKAGWLDCYFD